MPDSPPLPTPAAALAAAAAVPPAPETSLPTAEPTQSPPTSTSAPTSMAGLYGDSIPAPHVPYTGGWINLRGLGALCRKESLRFFSIAAQTLVGPVISTLLFYAVFVFALGRTGAGPHGVPYATFLVPGLVVMSLMQNAFANSSSSLMTAKMNGNIIDLLMPPLGPLEMLLGLTVGSVVRGMAVGILALLALVVFQPVKPAAPFIALWFALNGALFLGLLGVFCGVWATKWEHTSSITNFVITPLSFLSGTFYSISRLPEEWRAVALANPLFYVVDGFRYGILGVAESNLAFGAFLVGACNLGLFGVLWLLLARHWRLWD